MKKFLLSLLTVALFTGVSNAQQNMYYYVDMVGSPGQQFIYSIDTLVDISDMDLNFADTGAGVVWNFQNLDADDADTIVFDNLNAQEMTDFPTGNLVMSSSLGRIVFNKNVGTALELLGTSVDFGGFPVSLQYVPGQRLFPEMSGLHTMDSTTSYVIENVFVDIDTAIVGCAPSVQIDSIRLTRNSVYKVNFDATGELRLPLDTFPYTVRAISEEATVDSIFVYSTSGFTCTFPPITVPAGWSLAPDLLIQLAGFANSAVTVDTLRTASWYYPYTISPVCVVDYQYDPGFTDTTFLSVRYKGTDTPDIGFEQIDQIPLVVYPNPASEVLMLQTTADITDATMYIFNAQGQQVKAMPLNGANMISLEGMANGMYFYQLGSGKKLLHHGKFLIKK